MLKPLIRTSLWILLLTISLISNYCSLRCNDAASSLLSAADLKKEGLLTKAERETPDTSRRGKDPTEQKVFDRIVCLS